MKIKTIKKWAKEKIKGNIWDILGAYLISNILITIAFLLRPEKDYQILIMIILISIINYIFQIGLTKYMINFVQNKKKSLKELFTNFKNYKKIIITYLYQIKNIFLWALLLIIPGIIKKYSYSLVPYILIDNKNLKAKDILKLSEDMMKGHKKDLFILNLSFIGWHILSIYTLFILELWIIPYQKTANTKFLNDIKTNYNKK